MNCETLVGYRIVVPAALDMLARTQPWSRLLRKVGEDIWTTHEKIAAHSDSTANGLVTYGLILVNDPAVVFVHAGSHYDIPPGTLYRMDGRIEHSTEGPCGLLAALIWDMPNEWDLEGFAAELHNDKRFM